MTVHVLGCDEGLTLTLQLQYMKMYYRFLIEIAFKWNWSGLLIKLSF